MKEQESLGDTIQGGVSTPSTSAALFCFKLDFKINLIFHFKWLSFLSAPPLVFLAGGSPVRVPGTSFGDQTLFSTSSENSFPV